MPRSPDHHRCGRLRQRKRVAQQVNRIRIASGAYCPKNESIGADAAELLYIQALVQRSPAVSLPLR
jgi:hypothetical protein